MHDFDFLGLEGLFSLCTLLRISKQGVSNSISFALTIVILQVVTREFLDLVDLFQAQTLCIHKSVEVVLVNKHKNFMLKAF